MYRGLAKLLGMDVLPQTGDTAEELHLAVKHSDEYDFLFFHIKQTDSSGEDGNFTAKVRAIEEVDTILPILRALEPDVVIVTGDHATPAVMRSHSWHPVPVLLWSKNCRPDDVWEFGERMCLRGSLGPRFATKDLMPLACAHAGRLQKYGA